MDWKPVVDESVYHFWSLEFQIQEDLVRITLEVDPYIFLEGQITENIENFSLEILSQSPQSVYQITRLDKIYGLIASIVSVNEVVNDHKDLLMYFPRTIFKGQELYDSIIFNSPLVLLRNVKQLN